MRDEASSELTRRDLVRGGLVSTCGLVGLSSGVSAQTDGDLITADVLSLEIQNTSRTKSLFAVEPGQDFIVDIEILIDQTTSSLEFNQCGGAGPISATGVSFQMILETEISTDTETSCVITNTALLPGWNNAEPQRFTLVGTAPDDPGGRVNGSLYFYPGGEEWYWRDDPLVEVIGERYLKKIDIDLQILDTTQNETQEDYSEDDIEVSVPVLETVQGEEPSGGEYNDGSSSSPSSSPEEDEELPWRAIMVGLSIFIVWNIFSEPEESTIYYE